MHACVRPLPNGEDKVSRAPDEQLLVGAPRRVLARPEVEQLLQRRLLLLPAGGSKFRQRQDQERGRNTIQACCDQKCRIFWKDAYGVEGAVLLKDLL